MTALTFLLFWFVALIVFGAADLHAFNRILDRRSELPISEFMDWLKSADHKTAMRFGGALYLQYIAKRGA